MIDGSDGKTTRNGTEKGPDDGTTHGVDFSWGLLLNLSDAIPSSAKPCAKSDVGPEGGVSDMRRRWALVRAFTGRAEEHATAQGLQFGETLTFIHILCNAVRPKIDGLRAGYVEY
jgi:hypothetical protein